MHFSNRVLSELENGLIRELRFSFHGLSARELRELRIGDRIHFDVRVHNESGLPLVDLRGTLRHGNRTRFPAVTFEIPKLGPRACAPIASVRGVFRGPADPQLVDHGLASLALSTRIDLSQMIFEEWDKPVVLAPEASIVLETAPRRTRCAVVGKALPLST